MVSSRSKKRFLYFISSYIIRNKKTTPYGAASHSICISCTFKTAYKESSFSYHLAWLCPRPISNSQLHALPHFHLCPIYLVVFKGSYFFRMGYLILRGASRLDAFSVYPFPAWLLCHALGRTTDSPAASPTRSSRTKDSSSQISYAHAG